MQYSDQLLEYHGPLHEIAIQIYPGDPEAGAVVHEGEALIVWRDGCFVMRGYVTPFFIAATKRDGFHFFCAAPKIQ